MTCMQNQLNPSSEHNLVFYHPIPKWHDALPLGNGLTGCLVWGDGNPLILSLDRGDLWDTRPIPGTLKDNFTFQNLVELAKKGDKDNISATYDTIYRNPYPTKIPAGRIELKYKSAVARSIFRLNLEQAVAAVEICLGNRKSSIETYLHAGDGLGYIYVKGDAALPDIILHSHNFSVAGKNTGYSSMGDYGKLGYREAEYHSKGALTWFRQKTCQDLEFALIVGIKRINVCSLEAVYKIACSHDGRGWLDEACLQIQGALKAGYRKSAIGHKSWWQQFWSKSSIKLPDQEFEKQWYLNNYLFGSCSRQGAPPMPLQGVWTADAGALPPWHGDYHNDVNTQMSYWHYLKANHVKEGESFIDFLWNLMPQAREFAARFYQAPGICLPAVMSIDGKPLGGWPQYCFSPTMQIWLCQAFDHYWRCVGDEAFLKTKAYPYFKQTGEFILHLLKPGPDNKLYLPLSSSPEIHDNTLDAWVTPNSNFDLALLIYLFKTLALMSDKLGTNEGQRWRNILPQLPELAVDNNILMVSPDESLMESHRHLSHAMAIYPLRLLDYYSSAEHRQIIDATIEQLKLMGFGKWVGFTFPWMAALYAIQGNGEGAEWNLKLFWENFCAPNGFHMNGDNRNRSLCYYSRVFTLEGNMAAADALQEMLLYAHNGIIHVFPAVPEKWKESRVAFTTLRGENGLLVSAELQSHNLRRISLFAEKNTVVHIKNSFNTRKIKAQTSGKHRVILCPPGEMFPLHLAAGDACRLRPS